MPHSFHHVRPGPLTIEAAEAINLALDELDRLLNMVVVPPLYLYPCSGNYTLTAVVDDGFWARLDSESSGAYAWTEMVETTAGTFAVKSNGRTGTTTSEPAYERNATTGLAANTIVWMRKGFNSTTGSQEYLFDYDDGSKAATGYNQAQNAASNVTQRKIFNASSGLAAADNSGSARTDLTWAPDTWDQPTITIGDGSQTTITVTWNLTTGDPVITYSSGAVTITTGQLRAGGGSSSTAHFRISPHPAPPTSRTSGDIYLHTGTCSMWHTCNNTDKQGISVTGYPDLVTNTLAYYKLDETGTPMADSSGNGRTITSSSGDVTFAQPGKIGFAAKLKSGPVSNAVLTTAAHLYSLGDDSVTMAAWMKFDLYAAYYIRKMSMMHIALVDAGAGTHYFHVQASTTAGTVSVFSTTAPSLNTWYHVAARFDTSANTLEILVNGVSEASVAAAGTIVDYNDVFEIISASLTPSTLWVDDVVVLKKSASADEVSVLSSGTASYPYSSPISPGVLGAGANTSPGSYLAGGSSTGSFTNPGENPSVQRGLMVNMKRGY